MADTLTAAPTFAGLRQTGVANPPAIIVSPNTTGTLVVSAPAVVIAWHPPQVEGQNEPALLGPSVGAWTSGVAGASVASPVQVVALDGD